MAARRGSWHGARVHPNAELIERFYFAFKNRDHLGMAACYREDARFWDPVFLALQGPEIGAMWRMLCERGKDLEITWSDVHADEHVGRARWEAVYTFSKTKRRVHNVIQARFDFAGGKIAAHRDDFDLWRWLRMAIGPVGIAFGWLPQLQDTVRREARQGLDAFIAKHAQGRASGPS